MTAPRQHPVLAFAVALAAVGVLSVMDAVMKGLVLAIGLYATSVWRALAGVILSSALPSRLLSAFPPDVTISRLPLDEALLRVRDRLFGESGGQPIPNRTKADEIDPAALDGHVRG